MANEQRLILSLNCGSSSLKFGVFRAGDRDPELMCEGEAEEIGRPNGSFWLERGEQKEKHQEKLADHSEALTRALDLLSNQGFKRFWKAGHRVVHGGPEIRKHQALTAAVLEKLKTARPFAPLHLPASLEVIAAIGKQMPDLAQVICLDTAFHSRMPDLARTFALPEAVRKMGVERYGFHGLSLESILPQLGSLPEKLVVAHLGNGASITAICQGQSVDTTMGLTPTGGVMMGTRCGDLDPGVTVFLARHGFAQADAMEDLVNRKSGLAGVSEIASDVRQLMVARGQPKADLALRMFCYQVRKAIAAMAAAMDGIDLLVFTGGIGEHAGELRQEICEPLRWMGKFETRVLPAQEDLQIARIALELTN